MEGPPVGTVVQVERTVSKLVIDGKKAVLVDDVVTHPALGPGTVSAKVGLRCHLSIPIMLDERLLGTLNVASKKAGVYAETDIRLLQPIADQIGAMVERSRLYAEVQSQLSTVTHLYELASDLAGVADTVALFTILLRHIPRSLPADSVELYELTAAGGARLVFSGTAGVPAVTRPENDNGDIADGEIAAEARSVLLSARESGEVAAGHSGGEVLLAIPVKTSGNFAEAVLLRSASPEGYAPTHLRLAGSIGSLTGIAMDRIRLYDAILAKSSEIETKNRELDDFAYVVSHDLKEPLITIEGYAKILEADYAGRLDAEGLQFLGSIRTAGVRMKSMIEDLLTLARVGRATESEESQPLGDVLGDVLQDLEFSIREKRATVTVQGDLPSVTFDRAQLGIVFRNLISNALKFNTSTTRALRYPRGSSRERLSWRSPTTASGSSQKSTSGSSEYSSASIRARRLTGRGPDSRSSGTSSSIAADASGLNRRWVRGARSSSPSPGPEVRRMSGQARSPPGDDSCNCRWPRHT